jgi:hypothetical protein
MSYPNPVQNLELLYSLKQSHASSFAPQQLAPFHIPQQRAHDASQQQQPSRPEESRLTNASSCGGADVVYTGPGEMPKPAFGFSCDQGMRCENEDRLFCGPRLVDGSNPPHPCPPLTLLRTAPIMHAESWPRAAHALHPPVRISGTCRPRAA